VKGIERFLGAVETLEQSLIEVTSGQAKYEHHHRAIVWRMSRLPKEGQGNCTVYCHRFISVIWLFVIMVILAFLVSFHLVRWSISKFVETTG
jgi:hypothetical protein